MAPPLPFRYKNLPPEVSLDYRMNPDNLWVFWVKTTPSYEGLGKVLQGIALARPGLLGIDDLNKGERGALIGALSLQQLRQILQDIKSVQPSFKSKLPTWLGGLSSYLVLFEENQQLKTEVTESHSEEESHLQVLQAHPGVEIKWSTTVKPLDELLNKMEAILETEDYVTVQFDRRPDEPGHEWDWFEFMQRPDSYPKAKIAHDYFASHPGAWEEASRLNLADLNAQVVDK